MLSKNLENKISLLCMYLVRLWLETALHTAYIYFSTLYRRLLLILSLSEASLLLWDCPDRPRVPRGVWNDGGGYSIIRHSTTV